MSLTTLLLCFMASIAMVHGGVPAECLQCLCEASTENCNYAQKCHTSNTYYCGPFLITWNYWNGANKPLNTFQNPDQKGAFEDCVNNVDCAVRTINEYMFRNLKDCDGDGVVNCIDIVRIHKHGQNACHRPLAGQFGYLFETCANKFSKDTFYADVRPFTV